MITHSETSYPERFVDRYSFELSRLVKSAKETLETAGDKEFFFRSEDPREADVLGARWVGKAPELGVALPFSAEEPLLLRAQCCSNDTSGLIEMVWSPVEAHDGRRVRITAPYALQSGELLDGALLAVGASPHGDEYAHTYQAVNSEFTKEALTQLFTGDRVVSGCLTNGSLKDVGRTVSYGIENYIPPQLSESAYGVTGQGVQRYNVTRAQQVAANTRDHAESGVFTHFIRVDVASETPLVGKYDHTGVLGISVNHYFGVRGELPEVKGGVVTQQLRLEHDKRGDVVTVSRHSAATLRNGSSLIDVVSPKDLKSLQLELPGVARRLYESPQPTPDDLAHFQRLIQRPVSSTDFLVH